MEYNRDNIVERARAAQVFLQQPFWQDLSEYLHDAETAALNSLRDAKHGNSEAQMYALMRWRATEELVQRILNYPMSAIDMAREDGHKF